MSNLIEQMLAAGGTVEPEEIAEPESAGAAAEPKEYVSGSREENYQAARFLLSRLLGRRAYRTLELTEAQRESLVQSAIREPLPDGTDSVKVITKRLENALRRLTKERKAVITRAPKRGRLRPTLRYDHKTPIAPSRAIDCAIPFSGLQYNKEIYESPEDYLSALERRHGSESEIAKLEREERQEEYAQSAEALSLRLPVHAVLDRAPNSCSNCGKAISADQRRSTILRVDQPTLGEIAVIEAMAVHCEHCRDAKAENQGKMTNKDDESWTAHLAADELEAYKLRRQGLRQAEIGAKMTPPRSQATVSRLLRPVEQKRRAFAAEQLRKTGGS